MTTALEKVAQYTPQQLLLLSVLTGGAGFGGMRLLSDMAQKIKPIKPKTDNIELDLPSLTPDMVKPEQNPPNMFHTSNLGKTADDQAHSSFLWPMLAVGGGLPLGFLGAKALYDNHTEAEGNQDVELARKKYQQQLLLAQQLNSKTAEDSTPCIDGFCTMLAEQIEKQAFDYETLNPLTYVKPFVQHYPGLLGSAPPAVPGVTPEQIFSHAPAEMPSEIDSSMASSGRDAAKRLADKFTGGSASAAVDIWKLMAVMGAAGMGGYMYNNYQKKQERDEKSRYPTGVSYAQ